MEERIAQQDRETQAGELAAEILMLARSQLLVHFRFLDRAVANIRFVPTPETTFTTDGRCIYYSPWFVLNLYLAGQTLVARDLLHCLLHCIFRHNIISPDIDRAAWNLAADAAVENVIAELSGTSPGGAAAGRAAGKALLYARRACEQEPLLARFREEMPVLSAERIFHFLTVNEFSDPVLEKERLPFVGDDHTAWYNLTFSNEGIDAEADLEELWKEISKRMQTELEVLMGADDALTQNLRDINRTRYSYTEFLRRFGVHGEVMRLSDEEFDINYYTYGMDLYGDIPLIEPLEYKDQKKIRDFVIAIDTSGSVKGEVVQKFVQHTHDILARQESFDVRMNLYILQCDDRIQEAVHITCKEDFDDYLKNMKIKGLGETDFRPVFAYVNELLREKKLTDLRGLIYFTDGRGTFPAQPPEYDTAFILNDDGLRDIWTPEWAMKLYISEEEILRL